MVEEIPGTLAHKPINLKQKNCTASTHRSVSSSMQRWQMATAPAAAGHVIPKWVESTPRGSEANGKSRAPAPVRSDSLSLGPAPSAICNCRFQQAAFSERRCNEKEERARGLGLGYTDRQMSTGYNGRVSMTLTDTP